MREPLVSIVVPTYNRASLLPRLVESVLAQTYRRWELIFVDDGSTDATAGLLGELTARYRNVKVITLAVNGGAGRARNIGVQNAQGEYVAFLDDDDVALPERLATQLRFLQADPAIDLCFSQIRWMNAPPELQIERPVALRRGEIPTNPAALFPYLLQHSCIPTPTVVVKAHVMQQYSFAEDVDIAEDLYPILTMAANGVSIRGIPQVLVLIERAGRGGKSLDPHLQYRDHMRVLYRVFAEQRVAHLVQRRTLARHLSYYATFLPITSWGRLRMIARSIWLWPFQTHALRALRWLVGHRADRTQNAVTS